MADERPLTSWEDLLDTSTVEAWDAEIEQERDDLRRRFGLNDVVGDLQDSLVRMFQAPTLDFEVQYRQAYSLFDRAEARLGQELDRVGSASEEFSPIRDELRANLEQQLERVRAERESHAQRHLKYREALNKRMPKIRSSAMKTAATIRKSRQGATASIQKLRDKGRKSRIKAMDSVHKEWVKQTRR